MKVVIPILNNEYKVIFCCGNETYIKKVAKTYNYTTEILNSCFSTRRGVCLYGPAQYPIIAMPKFPETPEEIGTLAHEATHAINEIFRRIGELSSDEVYSHCVGAVVREVLGSK